MKKGTAIVLPVLVLSLLAVPLASRVDILSEVYLAEGSTAWGFETILSIINPNDQLIDRTVT